MNRSRTLFSACAGMLLLTGCQPQPTTTNSATETSTGAAQGAPATQPSAEASAAHEAPQDGSQVPNEATPVAPATTPEGAPVLPPVTTAREVQSSDNATRCARLVNLLLEDLGRMITYLNGTPEQIAFLTDRIRPFHERTMADRCVSATPDVLTCIETADNAFTGLAQCGINAGKPFGERLLLRPVIFDVPWEQPQTQVVDPAGAEQLRSSLAGQWTRNGSETWTFDTHGTARHVDAVTDEQFTVVATSSSRLTLTPLSSDGQPTGSVGHFSAATDGQTLFLTPLPDKAAVPMGDEAPLLISSSGYWLVWDLLGTPRCTGFYPTGQPVQAARCEWRNDPDRHRFQMVVNLGHDPQTGEPASDASLNFIVLGEHLVPELGASLFTRVQEGSGTAP